MKNKNNQLERKCKIYNIGTWILIAFGLGITIAGVLGAIFGNLTVSGFAIAGLAFVGAPYALWLDKYGKKIDELKETANFSVNGVTETEVKFETTEYTQIKEDKKEIIVVSPKELGLDESTNNNELQK